MLVDIKMEGMSGLDLLKIINDRDLDTAVVMITAYGFHFQCHRGHEAWGP